MNLVKDLPAIFEEFGEQQKKSFLEIKEYKEKGIPVIGTYCSYFPHELAIAVGAIPAGLCSYSNSTIPAAEKELPKSMCPLIKSSYGYAVEDKCPVFHFSDLIIGETTCDGKKKMYELLAEIKPTFVMELPNSQSEAGLKFWEQEIIRTKEYLEEFFNVVITDEKLRAAIHVKNEMRKALKRLCEVMKLDPTPISGEDLQRLVSGSKHRFDYETAPEVVNAITDKILQEYEEGKMLDQRPRILITGCPIGGDTLKIIHIIEENGGVVVAMDNCSGAKSYIQMVDEENPNLCEAIAEGYLTIGCSIMTPNDNRIDLIGQLIDDYKVDGVVELILTGCHSTGVESVYIRKFVNEEKGLPYISIDTDYAISEAGQISTKVAALLEMIAVEKAGGAKIDINHCYKILFSSLAQSEDNSTFLEKLYAYTKIPIAIVDDEGEVIAFVGMKYEEEWREWEHKVELEIPDGNGKCIGKCPTIQMKNKIRELLEIVARGYTVQKHTSKSKEKETDKSKPDYLWMLIDDISEEESFQNKIAESAHILNIVRQSEYNGILVSGIKGFDDRNVLIRICEEYARENGVCIAIGNGFRDLKKQTSNRNILERLFHVGPQNNPRKEVYLIEDYYQELAIDFVVDKIGQENYTIIELEKIKEEDKEKEGHLYETLFCYLQMKRNAMQTAAKLKIHRNTLLSRISRINEIINLDEKDGIECERLLLAMQLEKVNEVK